MKRIFIIQAILAYNIAVMAQSAQHKAFLGLTMGPSIPLGVFADNSPSNEHAGFAMTGYSDCLLNFGITPWKTYGISASLCYSEYNVDKTGTEDWWQVVGITAGPMFSFPLTNKLILDLKPKAGLLLTTLVIDTYGYDENKGTGFEIEVKASLRYNFARRWCVLEENGYFYTNQKYLGWRQKIQAITFDLGIAYRFL